MLPQLLAGRLFSPRICLCCQEEFDSLTILMLVVPRIEPVVPRLHSLNTTLLQSHILKEEGYYTHFLRPLAQVLLN